MLYKINITLGCTVNKTRQIFCDTLILKRCDNNHVFYNECKATTTLYQNTGIFVTRLENGSCSSGLFSFCFLLLFKFKYICIFKINFQIVGIQKKLLANLNLDALIIFFTFIGADNFFLYCSTTICIPGRLKITRKNYLKPVYLHDS